CKPPHPYAVLDWFHITDVWGELHVIREGQDPVRVWRIRLEKADLFKQSWWIAHAKSQTPRTPSPSTAHNRAPLRPCPSCLETSNVIFTAGWTCLNNNCDSFFKFPATANDGEEIPINELAYAETFLHERTPFLGIDIPPLDPGLPDFAGLHGTEKVLRRGFVCPDCGHCNRRIYWNRLACENCPYKLETIMQPYPDDELETDNPKFDELMAKRRKQKKASLAVLGAKDVAAGPVATRINNNCICVTQHLMLGRYQVRQYFLPDPEGTIVGSFSLFISNQHINAAPNGPNDMFREIELADVGLKRNSAAIAGHKLEGLTRHFQQNFGACYKFGVAVQSKGFDDAPDVVLRALHRLTWAGGAAVKAATDHLLRHNHEQNDEVVRNNDFNELLALGYMENDRINYHDDGEMELGPTVAALSLGSPSTMKFRPKLMPSDHFQGMPKKSNGKAYLDVLEVPMKHGDMMVMHGRQIHRYYEHAIEPMGCRQFSMTCRYIDPERMRSQADRDDAAVKGKIPAHSLEFVYNG
ncbi:hypothetical protein B0H66DRAFT_612078, partial [Apodospora peruviana]